MNKSPEDNKGKTCIFLGSGFSNAILGIPIQKNFVDDFFKKLSPESPVTKDKELIKAIGDIEVVMSYYHNLAYSPLATPESKLIYKRKIINLRSEMAQYLYDYSWKKKRKRSRFTVNENRK